MFRIWVPLALIGLCGCVRKETAPPPSDPTSQTPTTPTTSTTPTTPPATEPALTIGAWTPCDRVIGSGDAAAECATATVPLDWDLPEGPTLDLFVKRIPAPGATTHLWIVHGGPGGSAVDDLDPLSYGIPELRPEIEVYAVDHRGIGGSGRLGCPAEDPTGPYGALIGETEWPSCLASLEAEWGDGLNHITTTDSMRDLGALIDVLGEDRQIFVWGGSYGTYAVQRYLHLFGDQPDGVILEGIQHPARDFVGYDADIDRVSHDLFDVCALDPSCASHFAGDPWETAENAVAGLDLGHCPELGLTADSVRAPLGTLTFYWQMRGLVPAVLHRLDRCAPDDVTALQSLFAGVGALFGAAPPPGNSGSGYSGLLFFHVGLSEMWYAPEEAPSVTSLLADWRELTLSTGVEVTLAQRIDAWPRYPADAFDDQVPPYTGPLLMLQGGLDTPTPLDQASGLLADYDHPLQTWAEFPYAAHNVVGGSPTPDGDCALAIYLQFLDEPASVPDLSCIGAVPSPDFDGDPAYAAFLLGTVDAWGDGATPLAAPPAPPPPRIPRAH